MDDRSDVERRIGCKIERSMGVQDCDEMAGHKISLKALLRKVDRLQNGLRD